MGLFCFNCHWLYGVGPDVPQLIHERTCSNYDWMMKEYPDFDVDQAYAKVRRKNVSIDYAVKIHQTTPAYKTKKKIKHRNMLRRKARKGDKKASRQLRRYSSRQCRMVAGKIRSRTRLGRWQASRKRLITAFNQQTISIEQYREENKNSLEMYRRGSSAEEFDEMYVNFKSIKEM